MKSTYFKDYLRAKEFGLKVHSKRANFCVGFGASLGWISNKTSSPQIVYTITLPKKQYQSISVSGTIGGDGFFLKFSQFHTELLILKICLDLYRT